MKSQCSNTRPLTHNTGRATQPPLHSQASSPGKSQPEQSAPSASPSPSISLPFNLPAPSEAIRRSQQCTAQHALWDTIVIWNYCPRPTYLATPVTQPVWPCSDPLHIAQPPASNQITTATYGQCCSISSICQTIMGPERQRNQAATTNQRTTTVTQKHYTTTPQHHNTLHHRPFTSGGPDASTTAAATNEMLLLEAIRTFKHCPISSTVARQALQIKVRDQPSPVGEWELRRKKCQL
jgi:hypothetical protein